MQKKNENKRPSWSKPKLIILTRNQPAETVLVTCKFYYDMTGPNHREKVCSTYSLESKNPLACIECHSGVISS